MKKTLNSRWKNLKLKEKTQQLKEKIPERSNDVVLDIKLKQVILIDNK